MGKKKIDQLLAQLQTNHDTDVQNAAGIFTVAQGAVNDLANAVGEQVNALVPSARALPAAPQQLTKDDLLKRYGSYNGCRSAAKAAGITFSRPPRWSQIIAAFSYLDACQACIDNLMRQHPNPELKTVKVTLTLDGI